MAQVFPRQANLLARLSVLGILLLIGLSIWGIWLFNLSNWSRRVGPTDGPIPQPVEYSHAFHVGGLKMDCRYCHSKIEVSGYANVPATQTCMTCHSVIRTDSVKLQPVRDSWKNNTPIQWNKVHDLPGFVYFNHSSHIAKGVGCTTCHGPIGAMAYNADPSKGAVGGVYKQHPLFMSWCLECHRNPEKYVRPEDQVFNPDYQVPTNQLAIGAQLVDQYKIRGANQLTNCAICHR